MNRTSVEHFDPDLDEGDGIDFGTLGRRLRAGWWRIAALTAVGAAAGLAASFLIPPRFTARTVVMPPQQQQSASAAALNALGGGALGNLASGLGLGGGKSSAEQYVALLGSATISDRVIDTFKLMDVYEEDYRSDARKKLAKRALFTAGKKDGLIVIDVEDTDPKRAADMANAYVEHLRWVNNTIAVTEAQQRRAFFEQKLQETKERLVKAQMALQSSGINAATLKAEPRAAADGYARLRNELTAAEVKYQSLRGTFTDSAPELARQQAVIATLRAELARLESRQESPGDAGYVGNMREYKYQEILFETYARQYELARVDESREGGLIQVVDVATPPDKKAWPKPSQTVPAGAAVGLVLGLGMALRRRPGAVT